MNISLHLNKSFRHDIQVFKKKLKDKENFAFSKYADGEWAVIKNMTLNNGEFNYNNELSFQRDRLIESFQYKDESYYVGVSCSCCQNIFIHNEMKKFSKQKENHLTWANIWVNSNYGYFLNEVIPEFKKYKITLVAHINSKIQNLPFSVDKFVGISRNAWVEDYSKIEDIKKDLDILENGHLFLFCCGPFGNMLCHQLYDYNNNHTYLDIGSTLNPFLGSEGFRRGYFSNYNSMKPCIWGEEGEE